MSKLDDLIQQLCPNGVEFKTLEKIAKISNGRDHKHLSDGIFPVYGSGGIMRYADEFIYDKQSVLIPRKGSIGNIFYVDEPFWTVDTIFYTKIDTNVIVPKFFYYFLKTLDLTELNFAGGVPSLTKSILDKIRVPVPPLEVQREIVRILDNFTELTAELTAELEARKKQYNYYRDQLLTFEEEEVEWKSLGDVAEYSKTRISFKHLDETNYVGVDNLLQNRAGKVESSYIPTSGNSTEYRDGDILIGNIRPYLKKIWHADRAGGTNGDVLVIHITDQTVNSRYLYQVLADDKFFEYNMQHAKGAKMPRGNKTKIMEYSIPVPSLTEQARIVAILDKFDTLTTSISEGLPREIELRQKQYVYYRDKLLTFEEVS